MKTQWLYAVVGIALSCLVTSHAEARTWYVNPDGTGDVLTVQVGLDSAGAGDTVLIACGTYYEHDLVMKSEVCLRGEASVPPCVTIDAQHQGKLITSTYVTAPRIENLVLTNGASWSMEIVGSMTVRNCVFTNNPQSAVLVKYTAPEFYDCLFYGNGTAVVSVFFGNPLLKNCTLVENAGAVFVGMDGGVTIENSVVAFSTVSAIAYNEEPGVITIACSNFYGNPAGDDPDSRWIARSVDSFSAHPQFCGVAGSGNFYLQSDSPCAPGNHPDGAACALIGALPVMCGGVKTENRTWGSVKSLYGD